MTCGSTNGDGCNTRESMEQARQCDQEEIRLLRLQVETLQQRIRELEAERRITRARQTTTDATCHVTANNENGASGVGQPWSCRYCTFLNDPSRISCEVCEGTVTAKESIGWDVKSFRPEDIVCDS